MAETREVRNFQGQPLEVFQCDQCGNVLGFESEKVARLAGWLFDVDGTTCACRFDGQ